MSFPFRIGFGYDVHCLIHNRPLVLGGVTIPFGLGLNGHSDADVLLHAVMDAMLGAAGLGDIGLHFPDNQAYYKDISSLLLLGETNGLLQRQNWRVVNIDVTVVAQQPKIAPFRMEMEKNIARLLEIDENSINIKATTEEGLGFTGQGLGIAVHAVCLITKNDG
jgi:2-C-methyl-D-erythritol 2,4-cyclodiphosphate synthase